MNGGERNVKAVVPSAMAGGKLPPAPARRAPPPAPATPAPVGFRAALSGASLWDLVQMECLAQTNGVFEVSGEGGIGYLYLSSGRVVHAVTASLQGQEAALEILGWTHGSFEACGRPWPAVATITMSHEGLILQAAKRRDDISASNLVAFRGRGDDPDDVVTDSYELDFQESASDITKAGAEITAERDTMAEIEKTGAGQGRVRGAAADIDHLPDFAVMIRLAPNGSIVKDKGGSEELAGVVAYAHRLIDLVGELLGMERFMAIECVFKTREDRTRQQPGRLLLFTEQNGDTVMLRPHPDSDIQPLRESLGL